MWILPLLKKRRIEPLDSESDRYQSKRDKIVNICWIIEKAREFQKNFCFIDYAKAIDCVDHNKLWEILKEMGIPDHLTCLPRNLYAGQEATIRTRHGKMDWFQIGKGVCQDRSEERRVGKECRYRWSPYH